MATPEKPDLSEFVAHTEVEELRALNTKLQGELRRARTKTADLIEAVERGAKEASVIVGKAPKVTRPKKDTRKVPEEVALLHLSDWQYGKKTMSYSSQVADSRIDALAEKVLHMTSIERADHPVRSIHVMLGGDFIEGVQIFQGQAWEIDSTLFMQIMGAKAATVRTIRTLLSDFDEVHVWEEYGNHGRLGKRGDYPAEDNADLLLYRLAREELRDHEADGSLIWNETQGWYSLVQIGSYRALLVHGDEIKSFGGNIPAFGIAKKVNAWASGVIEPFTDCYMGHFHQPLVIPLAHGRGRTFVNPSIESDSIYAKEFVGASGTPGQRLHFIEPAKGRVTSERILWLDE